MQLLLKTMDKNINKYISLVTEMNNLVKGVKERCFWDVEIMERCKRWDDAVKNTVPRTDEVSSEGDEAFQNKVGQGGETIKELRGDGDATLEHENTGKDKGIYEFVLFVNIYRNLCLINNQNVCDFIGCDDVHNMTFDDGGISDSCLAALQTIKPGVYRQTTQGNKNTIITSL
ncbi:hypothetical protein HanPSC8_Chr04g0172151 [Helianthus annuus]|nr:hypothetical protein HanPSC8_Chr04g0172151 [Helianthus annuus]